jgi:hypothetical protein
MTVEVTPAAASPAAPAAAAPATPAAPAAPAAPASVSLLDGVAAAPAPAAAPAAAAPAEPAAPTWFYADGVAGKDKAPEWFKADKYKTVDQQAQAYTELEKRFGAFTGAPKDGKYEFKMPEGITGELDQEHPIYKGFTDWATKNQLSANGYNELLGMFAQYEAGLAPDMGAIKAELGEKADERIGAASSWAKANLDAAGLELFRAATSDANAAKVFQLIEQVIGKTRQVALPAPGADPVAPGAAPNAAVEIGKLKDMKDAKGDFLYLQSTAEGQALRHKIAAMEFALSASQAQASAA